MFYPFFPAVVRCSTEQQKVDSSSLTCFFFISMSQVEVERRPWLYNDDYGQQVGGFVKEFENIAFLTVKVNLMFDNS